MSNINSKNTKYDIAAALIDLTRNSDRPTQINISSVAFAANMHRNTIYYHFRDMRELCLWTIHQELSKAVGSREYFEVRDGIAGFFTRYKHLLDFTRHELGTEDFLNQMRIEILPLVEPFTEGPAINSEEAKKIAVDTFVEQIIVAYVIHKKPEKMIRLIFTSVMPEILRRELI
ncbi:MAG: hypothetical protein Q4E54_07180 [Lachnospiraceae bacterium]|nr:hypothetical protein [Lachnospiraceae bacterium]